jgi:hypothetical protein
MGRWENSFKLDLKTSTKKLTPTTLRYCTIYKEGSIKKKKMPTLWLVTKLCATSTNLCKRNPELNGETSLYLSKYNTTLPFLKTSINEKANCFSVSIQSQTF